MRKLNKAVAAVATLAIAASMAAPAFATNPITGATGSDSHDILATYDQADEVYKIDIDYGSMSFTYTEGTWDPDTFTFAEGNWSDAQTVKVSNSSNAAITAMVTATTNSGTGVTASVSKPTGAAIASAAPLNPNEYGKAKSETFDITLSGTPTVRTWSDSIIGSVTVTIE